MAADFAIKAVHFSLHISMYDSDEKNPAVELCQS
jgi:hypothetical protein